MDDVIEGRAKPDQALGRFLADTLHALPHLGAGELQQLFSGSVQDVLMVMYLGSLVRAQLALADRLSSHTITLLAQ